MRQRILKAAFAAVVLSAAVYAAAEDAKPAASASTVPMKAPMGKKRPGDMSQITRPARGAGCLSAKTADDLIQIGGEHGTSAW